MGDPGRRARRHAPLVRGITNLVLTNLVLTNLVLTNLAANVLLASGASPVMLEGAEEVEEMATEADALVLISAP